MPDIAVIARHTPGSQSESPKLIHDNVECKGEVALETIGCTAKTKFFGTQKVLETTAKVHRRNASDPCTGTLPIDYENESLEDLLATLCVSHEKLGDAHPKVGMSYNKIGTYHFRQGDFDAAASSYEEALKCYKLAYVQHKNDNYYGSKGALTVATILGNIGTTLWRTGKLHEATAYLEEALQIQEALFSANQGIVDSIDIARTLYNLGIALCLRGSYVRATCTLNRARKAFEDAESGHGPLDLEIARVVDAIGKAHLLHGNAKSAMRHHLEALQIKKTLLDARHPSVLRSFANVADSHRMMGEFDKALSLYRQVHNAQKVAMHRSSNSQTRKAIAADIGVTLNAMGEIMQEKQCKK